MRIQVKNIVHWLDDRLVNNCAAGHVKSGSSSRGIRVSEDKASVMTLLGHHDSQLNLLVRLINGRSNKWNLLAFHQLKLALRDAVTKDKDVVRVEFVVLKVLFQKLISLESKLKVKFLKHFN